MSSSIDLDAVLARVEAYAAQLLAEEGVPGFTLALTDGAGPLAFRAWGSTMVETHLPPGPETHYEIGSIGKSFTAIVLLQLAAEGRVDLHAPIADQLPLWEIPSAFEPVTPHHLLTHTSGLICGTDHVPSPEHELWQMRHARLTLPPNERFIYSNLGYKALGLLIEHVTGQPYADVIAERIFAPLGMRNATGAIHNDMRHRLAPGYTYRYDDRPAIRRHGWTPATWLETNTGDGCLATSTPDLATYLRALLNRGQADGGERILTAEQFATMTQPHRGETPEPGYGYGLTYRTTETGTRIGHSGGMVGYVSHMTGDLDRKLGTVVFCNAYGSTLPLGEFALDCLIAAADGKPLPELPAPRNETAVPNAADYLGAYHGAQTIEIVPHGDGIALVRDGETIPLRNLLHPIPDTFVADVPGLDRHAVVFHRDGEEGPVTGIAHGPDWYAAPGHEAPRGVEVPAAWRGYVGHYRSYNPWGGSIRVYIRKEQLLLEIGARHEVPLVPEGEGFLVTTPRSADERVTFGPIHNGQALAVRFDGGSEYSRVFTP